MTDPADEPRKQALPTARDLPALASRPTHAIAHPAWSEARETVLALVTAGPAMIVVLGPPGTGKTALLRDLAATFGEQSRSACLLDFGDSPFDVGPAEIVLVDEADRMSATRLDELRSRAYVAIILAALPASEERFAHYPDVTVVRLSPLSPQEARAFLVERLAQLGLPNDCLTEAAWTQLIACGRGVPRLLLILLGLALFVAGEEQAEQVTDAHVEQAFEVKGGSTDEPHRTEVSPAQRSIPDTILKGSISADTALDWISEAPPHRWRNRVAATAFAAVYLVAVGGLLTWGHLHMNKSTASEPEAPKVIETTPGHGLAPETSGSPPASATPASAMIPTPVLVPRIATASTQPNSASSASAASSEKQAVTTARLPALATQPFGKVATQPFGRIATQPFGRNVSAKTWVAARPLRCSANNWTSHTCRPRPRPVVWYRVRRCFIALGNLCLGVSYYYVRFK
jgi:hypothetical protein